MSFCRATRLCSFMRSNMPVLKINKSNNANSIQTHRLNQICLILLVK
jgi:hypothetical protein